MADKVVLDSYYGEVLLISGKCWFYTGATTAPQTGHTATSAFATCDDCLTGGTPIPFSPFFGYTLGDPHFIFGEASETDPTMASFNVDDNVRENELIWFTGADALGEYNVKYECYEFPFTAGGWSVCGVVIEDAGVTTTYAVSGDSNVTKNGAPWNSQEVVTIGNNVANIDVEHVLIPGSSNCNAGNDFSYVKFGVSPLSGMHELTGIGGAWWSIWKKAATISGSSAINNPSSAGFDGLSAFLSGFDGFTERGDFQSDTTTPAALREAYDLVEMNKIALKRNDLYAVAGSVNFDWDALMEDTPDCSVAKLTCPPVPTNSDPTLDVTLSWIDADVTKNWLGCSWTNGECKEVYSTNYVKGKDTQTISTSYRHIWRVGGNTNFEFKIRRNGFWYFSNSPTLTVRWCGITLDPIGAVGQLKDSGYSHTTLSFTNSTQQLGIFNAFGNLPISNGNYNLVAGQKTNSYTDSNGVTYAWTEGTGTPW